MTFSVSQGNIWCSRSVMGRRLDFWRAWWTRRALSKGGRNTTTSSTWPPLCAWPGGSSRQSTSTTWPESSNPTWVLSAVFHSSTRPIHSTQQQKMHPQCIQNIYKQESSIFKQGMIFKCFLLAHLTCVHCWLIDKSWRFFRCVEMFLYALCRFCLVFCSGNFLVYIKFVYIWSSVSHHTMMFWLQNIKNYDSIN